MTDRASKIIEQINSAELSKPREKARSYIGASVVGGECEAFLAFCLRGFPDDDIEPSLKRLFQLGHFIEDIVVKDLKAAGLAIMELDPTTRRQWTYEGYEGHVIGHADGLIEMDGEEVCGLEIKSMNGQMFDRFVEAGVLVSHPKYYAQMQLMMGLSGIKEFLFISYCKNNSKYHCEFVEFDELYWNFLKERVERILAGRDLKRITNDPEDFKCRFCNKSEACWQGKAPTPRCANCQHSLPADNAGWYCTKWKRDVSDVCDHYQKWEPAK
jgi:hypothetical protein